ncbi:MAG: GAF domain-containing protein, partial [Gemmatimonadaceae bacterium]
MAFLPTPQSHPLLEVEPDGASGHSPLAELAELRARNADLTRERDQLLAVVDILQDISSTLHFNEILQRIARKLGDMFGLDRSSIFLAGDGGAEVRLVATYEDPALRNLIVDLDRYPELRQAFDSGEAVFIPDAMSDPMLASVRDTLDGRNVRSIVVIPIRWRTSVIGAIFLRTERGAVPFSESDVKFCEVIASLTATVLRNAHRYESLQRNNGERATREREAELERIAMLAFMRRLFDRYATSDD